MFLSLLSSLHETSNHKEQSIRSFRLLARLNAFTCEGSHRSSARWARKPRARASTIELHYIPTGAVQVLTSKMKIY
ncbi:hypothetical protein RRG08_043432 [Elysia crispata]|uniref:Uncharacterized protein n=1 Tax=Elysia crispata TaxID=231223 RepID=A0AAE0YKT7_9GAST|nr:hypothetical protein RRG08_043432 [Elysia crispata]